MKRFCTIASLTFLGTMHVAAAISAALIHARDLQDRSVLEKLLGDARSKAESAPKDANLQYQHALIASVVAEVALEQKDKSGAEKAGTEGIKAAEAALAINGKEAEYHRVLATLCGEVIPANVFSALTYGKRAKDAIENAKRLNPNSAQVWIADGVGNFYLPAGFGGGSDPAIRSFQKAIQLDPKSAEAWLWLGRAQRKKQQDAEARKSFEKAVALDPDRIWAKQQLDKTPGK